MIFQGFKKKFLQAVKRFIWDEHYLLLRSIDQILKRCIPYEEVEDILKQCHSSEYVGHFGGNRIAVKLLQCSFY